MIIIKGFLIGFSIAAPVGPICILCIRQTIAYGSVGGLVTGASAAIADSVYTLIAAYGAMALQCWMASYQAWFYFGGGIFLLYLAHQIFHTKLAAIIDQQHKKYSLFSGFCYTFIMVFMSPFTTVLFLSLFQAHGIFTQNFTYVSMFVLALGVLFGAMFWWVVLVFFVSKLYKKKPVFSFQAILKNRWLHWTMYGFRLLWPELRYHSQVHLLMIINRLSALAIAIYGLCTLCQFWL